MGYYTRFDLDVQDSTEEQDKEITKEIYKIFGIEEDFNEESFYGEFFEEEMKWYDYQKDMKKLSKKFPELLFELSGAGEEQGDLWYAWFKNGKMQYEKAQVMFGEFDERKLK